MALHGQRYIRFRPFRVYDKYRFKTGLLGLTHPSLISQPPLHVYVYLCNTTECGYISYQACIICSIACRWTSTHGRDDGGNLRYAWPQKAVRPDPPFGRVTKHRPCRILVPNVPGIHTNPCIDLRQSIGMHVFPLYSYRRCGGCTLFVFFLGCLLFLKNGAP